MPDIVIRGISLPEGELNYMSLWIYGDGRVYVSNNMNATSSQRLQDLAIPLPEGHGGLYDRDALINELQNLFDKREKDAAFSGNRGPSVTWNDAICSIFAAPIIVPAEGGETNANS